MCGRFLLKENADTLVDLFAIDEVGGIPEPSYNIAPTQQIALVVESAKTGETVRRLESARWSLVPRFARDMSSAYPTFNARSETAAEKPTFRDSVTHMRALVPANGYYEWHEEENQKTPYVIYPGATTENGVASEVMAFAGLYAWWRDPEKPQDSPHRWILSASILTAAATGDLAQIHDRVPVLVAPEWWDTWLDPSEEGSAEMVAAAVAASREVTASLRWHPVAPLRGNGPHLIAPI